MDSSELARSSRIALTDAPRIHHGPARPALRACAPCLIVALFTAASLLSFSLAGCSGGPTREQVMRSQREYDLGVGLYQEQNVPGAFEHLLEAITLDPDNAEAHLMLGNIFMIHRADHERAEHHFREAILANQRLPTRAGLEADANNSLGVLYIHAERYDDAEVALRAAARDLMNREPAVAWTNLGWARLEAGDHDGAIEALRQAVQLSPQLCLAWYRIGQAHTAREELDQAEEALTRALSVENETCQRLQAAWRLRGEVRARSGHREEAIGDLERCVELSRDTDDGNACVRLLEANP